MLNNKPKAFKWIKSSFLSDEMKESYRNVLEERYERLC